MCVCCAFGMRWRVNFTCATHWRAADQFAKPANRYAVYERTALSKNKAAMLLKRAKHKLQDAVSADEEIGNPLLLEFLGRKDEYAETEL